MPRQYDLTLGSIPGHFRKLAVPAAVALLFSTLYNVVDVFFAGMIGTREQAGLAIAFQVFFLLIAFGIGLGSAMTALIGSAAGRKDHQQESQLAVQGLSYGIITTVLLTVLALVLGPNILELISTDGPYRQAAIAYFLVLITATPSFIMAFTINGMLQAKGDTRSMQYAMGVAFVANAALDPLFIFGIPGFWGGVGFNGIAIATVLSQTGVMLFLLWRAKRMGLFSRLTGATLTPNATTFGRITAQMVPVSFNMLVMILAGLVVQFYLKAFGETAVAAYGIALRIEQLFLLPVFGLTGALLPIAAQNFGAGFNQRVRQSLFDCWKFGWLFMCVACPLLWFAAGPAMGVFTNNADVITIGISYLHVDGLILPLYMMLFAISALLQALQRPIWVLIIGIARQGFAVAFFIWLWVYWLHFGVLGVWLGIGSSVLSGFLLSLVVAQKVSKPIIGGLWRPSKAAQEQASKA